MLTHDTTVAELQLGDRSFLRLKTAERKKRVFEKHEPPKQNRRLLRHRQASSGRSITVAQSGKRFEPGVLMIITGMFGLDDGNSPQPSVA